ncbi:MAG: hypothetical protein PVG20_04235 [Thioalkalispiraceae bacterium]|jgi:hypothetical protein
MKKVITVLFALTCVLFSGTSLANEVEIVKVMIEPSANRWTFHVTLKHDDTGWQHYADGWRIVDDKGKELGFRKLWHPHVEEQPFTRTLANVLVPKDKNIIYIEAHDKVHGWSKQRVRINMKEDKGPRYEIRRKVN